MTAKYMWLKLWLCAKLYVPPRAGEHWMEL